MTSPFGGRQFGVLLHVTSLPGRDDIGTLGEGALRFVDWLAGTGAGVWQILPLTMHGQHGSPYFSSSAFAVSPDLVDLELLHRADLLPDPRLNPFPRDTVVPVAALPHTKRPQVLAAGRALLDSPGHPWRPALDAYRAQEAWLADTALYFVLKEQYGGSPWWAWPTAVRERRPDALAEARQDLEGRIAEWEAAFFFADAQWHDVRQAANLRGLKILGDLPIYVSHDSADVWLNQEQFLLDGEGRLAAQSGVPPDYFSAAGQLWGNPLYRWDVMAADGFRWWLARLRRCLDLSDVVRIDHFRALSAYWSVPAGASDARGGQWLPGPGQAFIDTLSRAFPGLPFVAEDLGTLDDDVYRLRDYNGLLGMRVLQFGFDGTAYNPHLPHTFPSNCIAYPGTHDNQTVAGWWAGMDEGMRRQVAAYYQFDPGADQGRVAWSLIEAALGSRADLAVIPMQDLLVLDDRARMNDPATFEGNWAWRMPLNALSGGLADSLRGLATRYGRA